MRPAPRVEGTLFRVGQACVGHAQQRAAILVDEVDLDEARSRGYLFTALPTEAVGEAVHRHDLAKGAAGGAVADAVTR